jgi:transposase-like protein
VSEARENNVPVSEVCRRPGISVGQFYSWEKRARQGALEALRRRSGQRPNREVGELRQRLDELRTVVTELITENLQLKKGRWP